MITPLNLVTHYIHIVKKNPAVSVININDLIRKLGNHFLLLVEQNLIGKMPNLEKKKLNKSTADIFIFYIKNFIDFINPYRLGKIT